MNVPFGFKANPFYPGYAVSTNGEVYDCKLQKQVLPKKYESKSSVVYVLQLASKKKPGKMDTRLVKPARLIAETYVPVPDDLKEAKKLEVLYKDGDSSNLSIDNLYWGKGGDFLSKTASDKDESDRIKWKVPQFTSKHSGWYPNPVECLFKPGYYYIPNLAKPLVCNKEGKIFNLEKNEYVNLHKSKTGYLYLNTRFLVDENDPNRTYYENTIRHHRIVARLFCPGRTKEKNEVNHIDGNKENNRADNLEWISASENIQHAIQTGLFNHDRVLAKDIRTGEIKLYMSTVECARAFGVGKTLFARRVKNGTARRYTVDWHVFKADDGSDWLVLLDDEKVERSWDDEKLKLEPPKGWENTIFYFVYDTVKGEADYVINQTEAAKLVGLDYYGLSYNFRSYGNCFQYEHYQLRKLYASCDGMSQIPFDYSQCPIKGEYAVKRNGCIWHLPSMAMIDELPIGTIEYKDKSFPLDKAHLLAFTYLHVPKGVDWDNLTLGYRDGNPKNDSLDNLVWLVC